MIDARKSAMENLFSAAKFATLAFKSRAAKAGVVLTKEEWDDLIDDVVIRAVDMFIKQKVIGHTYNRKYSFFHNVRSCVWSWFGNTLDKHMKNIKEKILSVDRLEPDLYEHVIENARPSLYPAYKERESAQLNLRTWCSLTRNESHLEYEDAEDFFSYLEACEETGLPIKKDVPLYRRGREVTGEGFARMCVGWGESGQRKHADKFPEDRKNSHRDCPQ
jgi:hypothetical protein